MHVEALQAAQLALHGSMTSCCTGTVAVARLTHMSNTLPLVSSPQNSRPLVSS